MRTRVKPPFSRVNGLQWPLNVWQLGASFVFILQTLLFLVYICPYEDISEPFGCFLVSFCSFTTAGTLALFVPTSYIDPGDNSRTKTSDSEELTRYCGHCEAKVHETSRHCTKCNKCVVGLDHHCKWLNTCIGSKNYTPFIFLVGTCLLHVTTQLWASTYFLLETVVSEESSRQKLHDSHVMSPTMTDFRIALGVNIFLCCLLLMVIGELFTFHVILIYKNITTYDFIMASRAMFKAGKLKGATICATCCGCCTKRNKVAPGVGPQDAAAGPKPKSKFQINICTLISFEADDVNRWTGGSTSVKRVQKQNDRQLAFTPV